MKLLIVVLCLLSERFLIHSLSYTRFFWLNDYYSFLTKKFQGSPFFTNSWVILFALLVPLLLPVFIIYCLFYNLFFGFFGFLLNLFLFFYCMGPHNMFYPICEEGTDQNKAVGDYFVQSNTQIFALLFWYILFGPIVALAYRLITLFRSFDLVGKEASELTAFLEWIPAKMTAFLFLLVGNFQQGFSVFKDDFLSSPKSNDYLLSQCGLQALKGNENEDLSVLLAQNLVELALVLLLALIAFFTLAAWL